MNRKDVAKVYRAYVQAAARARKTPEFRREVRTLLRLLCHVTGTPDHDEAIRRGRAAAGVRRRHRRVRIASPEPRTVYTVNGRVREAPNNVGRGRGSR